MPWLTELLKKKVAGPSGAVIGRVTDLAASRTGFPRITSIQVCLDKANRELLAAPSKQVFFAWAPGTTLDKTICAGALELLDRPPEGDMLLRQDLLDSQIVDIHGARVVRVNDLLLSESGGGLSVVGADVGFKGVLRGLGLEAVSERLAGALGYEIPSKLIAWNYVAPLSGDRGQVQLTVPARLLKELHPSELAYLLDQLDPDLRQRTFEMMSAGDMAETLAETRDDLSREALANITDERARRVIELMEPDEAADLLGALGYARSERLLALLGVKEATVLRELLGHPPDSAGGRMTPSFMTIPASFNAGKAIEKIRSEAHKAEAIFYSYVLDDSGRLQGVLSLRKLLRSTTEASILEMMEPDPITALLEEDQQEVARLMARYNLLALPVVDKAGVMKGIVTVDDIVDVLEQEGSEDLGEVTGVYLGEGVRFASGRLAGFGVSIVAGVLAVWLLESQQAVLAATTGAWLLPLYLRIAQDSGTWSLARATQNMEPEGKAEVFAQEMLASLAASGLSGILVAVFGSWWTGSPKTGSLLGAGIFVGSLLASLAGLLLPTIARSAGMQGLLSRGRALVILVGMLSLVVYVWALRALAGQVL